MLTVQRVFQWPLLDSEGKDLAVVAAAILTHVYQNPRVPQEARYHGNDNILYRSTSDSNRHGSFANFFNQQEITGKDHNRSEDKNKST